MTDIFSNIPITDTPLARIYEHEFLFWSCVADKEQHEGWIAFHNKEFPDRIDPNHAYVGQAHAGQSAAMIQEIVEFYQSLGAVPAVYINLLTAPKDMPLRLRQANFREWSGALSDIMLYVGPDVAPPTTVSVEVVKTDAEKAAWASILADEEAREARTRAQLQAYYVAQLCDPHIWAYLVRVNGKPASRCLLFSSQGMGRIEAVRTLTPYRGRGLATAVIRRALHDSLKENHTTYIYVEPGSHAQRLYHRLGFRGVLRKALRGFLWQG